MKPELDIARILSCSWVISPSLLDVENNVMKLSGGNEKNPKHSRSLGTSSYGCEGRRNSNLLDIDLRFIQH